MSWHLAREGATAIVRVTHLPAAVTAILGRVVDRGREPIAGPFPTRTDRPRRAATSLGDPGAAWFAFGMSVVAGTALAVPRGNPRAAHGDARVEASSDFALVAGRRRSTRGGGSRSPRRSGRSCVVTHRLSGNLLSL